MDLCIFGMLFVAQFHAQGQEYSETVPFQKTLPALVWFESKICADKARPCQYISQTKRAFLCFRCRVAAKIAFDHVDITGDSMNYHLRQWLVANLLAAPLSNLFAISLYFDLLNHIKPPKS